MLRIFGLLLFAAALLTWTVGCGGRSGDTPGKGGAAKKPNGDEDHGHGTGAHGGQIIPIGRDNYHAEVKLEPEGVIRFYTLGKDEAKVQEVKEQKISLLVQEGKEGKPVEVVLEPEPQASDSKGKTSRFTGKLPRELWEKELTATSPGGVEFPDGRFRINPFKLGGHKEMPKEVKGGSQAERDLFLTSGGLYTAADIKANGNTVPSVKYAGIEWPHDDNVKPGDRICPVTNNKADPKCTWIVGGKEYQFCCPPCLTRFVRWAKTEPDRIKKPEEYVKK
jgi:hypothetical protein